VNWANALQDRLGPSADFDVPTLVSYVSQFMSASGEDVISTGHPGPGVGFLGMKAAGCPERKADA